MDIRKFFAKADGKKNGANAAATAAKSKTTTTERQPETPSTVASDEEVEQQENHVFHESLLSNAKKKEPERAKPKTVSKSSTATATNAAQPKTTIAKRKQEPTKYNVGTKVEKFFPGDGTDRGKVISIRNDNDEVLYKVEYSNGNRQEYNETELEAKLCTSKQDTDEPLDDAKVAATMSPRVTKKPRVDYEKESNRNNDNKEEESDDDDEVVPSSRPRKTSMARRKILDDDSSDDENVDMQVDDASPQKQEPPPTKKVTAKTSSTAPPAANAWGSLMMDRGQSAKKPKKQSSDRKPAALKDDTSMEVDETSSAKKQSKRKSVALKDDTKVDETSARNEQPSPAKKPKTNGWGSLVVDRGQSATKKPKKGSTKDMTSTTASGAKRIVKPAYCKGDDLPVITEPAKMFDDMVFSSLTENGTNAAVLLPLLKKVQSSPIRVATMCSGTESPVLALDMLSKSIQDFYHAHQEVFEGVKVKDGEQLVQIEHVFSAEIEPWKQSYIERNFHPPLLFRDIRELGNEQAYTAYGALVDVPSQPGCVDLLVAGTSCVDYSNLNNEKKTIKDGGESGQTWRGMIEWIKKAAPPMVILENVIGAPWKEKIKVMEGLGYYAAWVKVDTKDYYIPHTRQRGYLFAVKKDSSLAGASPVSAKATKEWADTVLTTLKRPASGALDAFMLPNDDPRVLLGRVRMATSESADNKSTDWSKCETRHLFARASEELGEKRPLTGSDSGSTTLPPFAWNEWASAQVQRIHDLMDILTLRCAKEGVDCTHKTMVWNLSQNVDRDTIGRLGLSQCLTPSGVPYVSNRGGPLVGEELLLLQGIPAEDLLLTKETEKNLKDLAGNAMSTTVVGACMLGALLYGHPAIGTREAEANISSDMMGPSLVPRPLALATGVVKITRDMANYEKAPLLLGALEDMTVDSFHKLLREAVSSARMCMSEGPDEALPLSSLLRCKLCGFTCSKECASPFPSKYEEHDLVSLADSTDTRVSPAAFRTKCLSALPMRVKLHSFDFASIQKPREVSDEVWNGWKNAAMATTASSASSSSSEEYRFTQLKRSHMWTAVFISSNGSRLELQLSSQCAVWLLFASTPSKKGLVGEALERPIARMRVQPVDGNVLMNGNWEVCLPTSSQIELTIEGVGAKLPSWRSRLGLKGPYESELRFEKLKISVETNDCAELKDAIDGQYESLLKCGAPCGSLHKRCGDESEAASSDMYFFLESGRYTVGDDDTFVFSPEKHRTSYNEYKNVVAKVCKEANYRPEIESECNDQPRTIRAITQGSWVVLKGALLRPASSAREMQSTVMVPMESPRVALSANGWKAAPSIIEAQVSLGSSCDWLFAECSKLLSTSTTAPNVEVNIQKSASIFRRLAFATSRLDVPLVVQDWLPLDSSAIERKDGDEIACEVCAPAKPALKWHMIRKGKSLLAVPIEDGKMQARFEYAMKHRPHPWLVTLEIPEQDTQPTSEAMLHVKVGINAVSLIHRALGLFPLTEARRALIDARHDQCGTIFEWRVVPHVDKPLASFPKLSFTSNKGNEPAKQPPGFQGRCLLRPEQLRSLAWMLSQEASSSPFYEEEVVEAILPNLNWRAEARAKRPVLVRGGIVADEVGYGKTAITLGLIDAAQTVNGDPPEVPAEFKGSLFYTKATLVIVPTHLMGQWPKEVKKFLGSNKKVIEIKDIGSMNKLTVSDIMHADLVIANFNLLSNDKYFSRLARFSGVDTGSLPKKKGGRHFDAIYKECLTGISRRIALHRDDCSALFDEIEQDARRHESRATKEEHLRLDSKKAVYKSVSEEQAKASGSTVKDVKTSTKTKMSAADIDPWNLKSAKDFKKMQCPPLEMFFWQRLVIDEFTYLREKADRARVQSVAIGLKSSFRWALSATPAHETFSDIRGLAALLGIHLGIDEDLPGEKNKKDDQETPASEKFSSLLEIRSVQWHEKRHLIAQSFLNRFVRQNIAEIDEIKCEEHTILVRLPAAERGIYLELETYLRSLDMAHRKALKTKKTTTSDRENRMRRILEDSHSGEEALLKRCAHFNKLSSKSSVAALETCNMIIEQRQRELSECEAELISMVAAAIRQRNLILEKDRNWKGTTRTEKGEVEDTLERFIVDVSRKRSIQGGADDEIHQRISHVLEKAQADVMEHPQKTGGTFLNEVKDGDDDVEVLYSMKFALRNYMHKVRSVGKELRGRMQSLRYFRAVRDFQLSEGNGHQCVGHDSLLCDCQASGGTVPCERLGVLSSCGHVGCLSCLESSADREACIEPSCQIHVKRTHIASAIALGADEQQAGGGRYGAKLTSIVDKVKEVVANGDRAIVFSQFDDLKKKIGEALLDSGVKSLEVEGTVQKQVKTLDILQKETPAKDDPRVLLLTMDNESSAGVNLTTCNHAFFVHPLLADSQQQYDAYETQAIGRIRRYGQTKTVHVWRYLAHDTIDMEIYKQRRGAGECLI